MTGFDDKLGSRRTANVAVRMGHETGLGLGTETGARTLDLEHGHLTWNTDTGLGTRTTPFRQLKNVDDHDEQR